MKLTKKQLIKKIQSLILEKSDFCLESEILYKTLSKDEEVMVSGVLPNHVLLTHYIHGMNQEPVVKITYNGLTAEMLKEILKQLEQFEQEEEI